MSGRTGPANAPSRDVALSGNGRVLAFVSPGTNLAVGRAPVGGLAAPGAGLSELDQIFTDELGGEPGEPDGPLPSLPELASESADGDLGSAGSGSPALDFDGYVLAFESEVPNLVADDTNVESDVFIVGQVLPVLDLQLNADRFRPGDTLILTARLDPGSHRRLVDAYLVLQVPDGSLFSLFGDRLVPGVVPVARFVPVPFEAIVLTYTFVGGEPAGSYSWFAALTEAGTTRVVRGLPGIDQDPFTVGP